MTIRSQEGAMGNVGEETPLLIEQTRSADRDDMSSETLMDAQRRGDDSDEEDLVDLDKANQQVGRLRGFLIVFSL
ncbi:hypothetical protein WAI453_005717 [Rhynchosporium graminicola]